ncbi:MAG: hypothetical protein ACR2QW_20570 [bacterium]
MITLIWPWNFVFAVQLVPPDMVSGLDDLEVDSIDSSITYALNTLSEYGKQEWVSSNGIASGYIKILRSFEFDSHMCREIEIVSKRPGSSDQRTVSYCQGIGLDWYPLGFTLDISQ